MKALRNHSQVREIRHIELINTIEREEKKETKKAFDPKKRIGWHIFRRAMDMGLVLRPMGDIIYFNPPLNIEKTDLDKAVELCRKAVVTVLGE